MAAAGAEVVTTVVDFSWIECRKERLKQQRERCGSIGGVARVCCALVCLCMRGVCVALMARAGPSAPLCPWFSSRSVCGMCVSVCGGREWSTVSTVKWLVCVYCLHNYDSWL